MPIRPGVGPIPARVMLVGEAYGEQEEHAGEPFVGPSGQELNRILHEAGIMRSECYVTNLVNQRPPNNDITAWVPIKKKDITSVHVPLHDKKVLPIIVEGYKSLLLEIETVKPSVIIPFGNSSLWALTQKWGIGKWRGSILDFKGIPVVPTYHPAAILRQWDWRYIAVNDLRRAASIMNGKGPTKPQWNFIVRPTFTRALEVLSTLRRRLDAGEELWLDLDIETRAGHIACIGISWTLLDAICLPLMCVERKDGFWLEEEEVHIVYALYKLLTHPRVKVRGQNLLYDCQYIFRYLHFIPRVAQDTMISHHTCFSGLPKRLDFQASMYCEYPVFWKDDGKEWDKKMGEDQLWSYNLVDCVRTRECGEVEAKTVAAMKLEGVEAFQQGMFYPVLRAMTRGVRVDLAARRELQHELRDQLDQRQRFFLDVLGHQLNPRSPLQMTKLFYEDLRMPPQMTRAKKGVPGHLTCDDEALMKLSAMEPFLKPLINAIADVRTLGVFLSTFIEAELGYDQRMRSSFNICGTNTFRLSSSQDAFGSGANLQNIPSDKSKTMGKAAARGSTDFNLPNIRRLYIPDEGMTFFDLDLDRADLQVVVWEANDALLKTALRLGADVHLLNVYSLDGRDPPPLEELVEAHPKYWDHRGPRKHAREFAKVFCHATNYGGSARTVAAHTGRSVHEVDRGQALWYRTHPGIKAWQERTRTQVNTHHFVENKFGYRWYIFDRLDMALNEALAWVPQSTVGNVINRAWKNIYDHLPEVEVLLQVHDSLAGQFPTAHKAELVDKIKKESLITVPYPDPLVIPVGIKVSENSWGACL